MNLTLRSLALRASYLQTQLARREESIKDLEAKRTELVDAKAKAEEELALGKQNVETAHTQRDGLKEELADAEARIREMVEQKAQEHAAFQKQLADAEQKSYNLGRRDGRIAYIQSSEVHEWELKIRAEAVSQYLASADYKKEQLDQSSIDLLSGFLKTKELLQNKGAIVAGFDLEGVDPQELFDSMLPPPSAPEPAPAAATGPAPDPQSSRPAPQGSQEGES